jgi:hypothetical protein
MDLIINGNLVAPDGSLLYAKKESGSSRGAGTITDPFIFNSDSQLKERLLQVPGNQIAVFFMNDQGMPIFPVAHKTVSYLSTTMLSSLKPNPYVGEAPGNDTIIKCIGLEGTMYNYSVSYPDSDLATMIFENCILQIELSNNVPNIIFNNCVIQYLWIGNSSMASPQAVFNRCYISSGFNFGGVERITPTCTDCFSADDYTQYGITQEYAGEVHYTNDHWGFLNPELTGDSGIVGLGGGDFPWSAGSYPSWFYKITVGGSYLLKDINTQKWYRYDASQGTLQEIPEPSSAEEFLEKSTSGQISANFASQWPNVGDVRIVSIIKQTARTVQISPQPYEKLEMVEDIVFEGIDPARPGDLQFSFSGNQLTLFYSTDGGETYKNMYHQEVDMSKPLAELFSENPMQWGMNGIPINPDGTLSIRFFFVYYCDTWTRLSTIHVTLPIQGAMRLDRSIDVYKSGNGDFILSNVYAQTIEIDCVI